MRTITSLLLTAPAATAILAADTDGYRLLKTIPGDGGSRQSLDMLRTVAVEKET